MEEKRSFGDKLEAFFAGKGFYIVLFLCVAVIGVSAWTMLAGAGTDVEESGDMLSSFDNADSSESIPTGLVEYPVEVDIPTVNITEEEPDISGESSVAPEAEPQLESQEFAPVEETQLSVPDYFIWPVNGEIETPYSMAALTYNTTMRDWRTHDGVDIYAELGAQVKAAGNGTVSKVYEDDMYGTTVVIRHNDGLESIYSNLASTPTVSEGQMVSVGQVIGSVGDTALCETGLVTHLHFAMSLNGESVDPCDYMP